MSVCAGSASPQSLFLLCVQCVSLFFLLIVVLSQQTHAEKQLQQQQQQQQQQEQNKLVSTTATNENKLKAPNINIIKSILHENLRFEPAYIDFGIWPVGTAHSHTITLINEHINRSVLLNAISGRTPEFYSSFFEHKTLAPLSNTTFQVVFLPRDNGEVKTDLHIHTSFGEAELQVRGIGRECPYRLKPLTGIKAPLNATLMPQINMYNPHDTPLQILEIYSSGGQFQLELPSGGQEGPQTLWTIPPYTQKPVIRIRFHARSAGNFSAYIRIKIATGAENMADEATATTSTVLVLPVEFEILPQTGLYAQNAVLDFGRLSTDNAQRALAPKIKLQLRQSNERRPHDFLGFNMRILAGLIFDPLDNSLIVDPRKFNETTILDELIILRAAYKRNISALQEFTVRLRAHIFLGGLHYKPNISTYLTMSTGSLQNSRDSRKFVVRNDFELPLVIYNISVPTNFDASIFRLQLMPEIVDKRQVLQPGKKLELWQLQLLNDSVHYSSKLLIHTNISDYELLLSVCSGRLHVVGHNVLNMPIDASYNATLHLGAIPDVEISHQGWVTLINRNPTSIRINDWRFESPRGYSFQVALMGCVRHVNRYVHSLPIEIVDFRICNQMATGDVMIFEVALQEYMAENKDGVLNIWTPYEHIKVAVKFHSWKGKIELVQEQLTFHNCFPGKTCASDIYIISSLPIAIEVGSVEFNNHHFKFWPLNDTSLQAETIVQPRTVTKIGHVQFEAKRICPTICYIPAYDKNSNKRLAFPSTRNGKLIFDELELRRRTELFRQLKWYFQTMVFTLTTRKVYQFQIPMPISSVWPKLVAGGRQTLPLVEVGKPYVHHIVIKNPADTPLLVDYVISDQRSGHLSLPLEIMDLSASCLVSNKPVFSLATPLLREPLLIAANSSLTLPIRFQSAEVDTYCTLIHLRNNLTLYEPVWITARTVQPQFRFGNRKPGNVTPMMFEIKRAHLAACHEIIPVLPLVAVKRTFTARNAGELPIYIESFKIGDYYCQGYGFRVLNCESFELKANSSRKIEISFTPDFSLSRVQRPLILQTNLSSTEFRYELLATLPAVNLDSCSSRLPRPAWEKSVRNAGIMLLACTFIFVILATQIDYSNIMYSQSLLYNVRQRGPIYPTFNLRNIMQRPFQVRLTVQEQVDNLASNNDNNGVATHNHQQHNSHSSSVHRRRGRKSSANSVAPTPTPTQIPTVGIGRNMSLNDLGCTPIALETSVLQNFILTQNKPEPENPVPLTHRDITPTITPPSTPSSCTTSTPFQETQQKIEELSNVSVPTPEHSMPPSPAPLKSNANDKENDRESGISVSSTTSAETEGSISKKKQQQQHVSRAKRSKLLAQERKAEKEREREKLRQRQLEKEREQLKEKELEREKQKELEKERQKEKQEKDRAREREKRERERERRYREQLEKERLEKEEQDKEREKKKERELAREKEREKEREREQEMILEKQKQEKEKELELARERERQAEIALKKEQDLERERELKAQKEQRELERQTKKEMEREKREEMKRLRDKELLELERQMKKEMEREKREKREELKRQRDKELLELERQMKKELEREKREEIKRQREKELEMERQKKKEMEREKREEMKRQELSRAREKQAEMARRKEQDMAHERELKAQRDLERQKKKEMEREKREELQRQRDKELLELEVQKEIESKRVKTPLQEVAAEVDKNVDMPTSQVAQEITPFHKNSQSSGGRKHGKTPGRERRKDNPVYVESQVEKKQKHKAVQALLFDNELASGNNSVSGSGSENASPNLPRSPWESGSQVSLGDLIQNRMNVDMKNELKESSQVVDTNANELGPIGSRKSPSSTPVWESVQKHAQNVEKPIFPKPILSNNSSFFSNLPGSGSPNLNSFGLGDRQFMGIPSNLYELQKVQMELQRQLQTNEFIINLHQQQQRLQQQQELLQGAGDMATVAATAAAAAAALNNSAQWQNNNNIKPQNSNQRMVNPATNNKINNVGGAAAAAWSPMGYRQAVDLNLVNPANNNNNALGLCLNELNNHAKSNNNNNMNNNNNNNVLLAPWQQLGLARPPPGLNVSPNPHVQQHNFRQQQPQQPAPVPTQQQQQQQQPADMPQFDPFKSLSSIWSENWHKNGSK